ncbi:MAG: metallophosphoesterase, partial [Myxococcota bacterium]
ILDEPWDAIGRVGWVPPSQGGPKLEFEVLRAWSPPRITRPTASSAQLMVPGLDIIGDVHGCSTELDALLAQLGWSREGQSGHWSHPEDRMVVFVGDLTDRGPDSIGVLLRAVTMVDQGQALLVRGNHDDKLLRWLQGRSVELKHGLETTVAEFEDLTHDQRKALTQTATTLIANSPLWATWHAPQGLIGDPELVIAHAAWSPDVPRWPLGRARAYCLFGPTTSTPSPDGLPQRLDWRQRYPTRGPSCVFGHSPFQGPVQWYRNTLALDTACVFGHRLSALRWPERDVVQVDARAPYAEPRRPLEPTPPYVLEPMEETPMNDTDANLQLGPDAAFELRLDRLLESLHRQPEAILSRIDGDAMLLKREGVTPHGQTMVIVNASKSLFTPQHTHQLYAKGLVYTREPWRPVSIPFLKIYNLGERDDTRALAVELSRQEGVTAHFNDKLDGTMVQSCCIASQVVLTTRGTFDLADPATSGFDYLGEARRLLHTQSPGALDPDQVQGRTLLWELIHPESRLVTDYGDRKALILTGAVDHRDREPRYVTRSELEALARSPGGCGKRPKSPREPHPSPGSS